jgi:hypothetical protein
LKTGALGEIVVLVELGAVVVVENCVVVGD